MGGILEITKRVPIYSSGVYNSTDTFPNEYPNPAPYLTPENLGYPKPSPYDKVYRPNFI